MFQAFAQRSSKLELIDTGDYTADEYEQFLSDIRRVNRFAGDNRALNRTLIEEIKKEDVGDFSVLDIGAGSGEILRTIARFARKTDRVSYLCGLELNERSAEAILEESTGFGEISSVRGNALDLPFEEASFDYVICSLFTHHFREPEIRLILKNMSRVARKKIFVIDLHRHPVAYGLYQMFCAVFVKGKMVKEDGSLSILRGFSPDELEEIAIDAQLAEPIVKRYFPFRLVLEARA